MLQRQQVLQTCTPLLLLRCCNVCAALSDVSAGAGVAAAVAAVTAVAATFSPKPCNSRACCQAITTDVTRRYYYLY